MDISRDKSSVILPLDFGMNMKVAEDQGRHNLNSKVGQNPTLEQAIKRDNHFRRLKSNYRFF
jgi:hypothetical protein